MPLVTAGPTSLSSAASEAADATFRGRVTIAVAAVATAVLAEDSTTTNHAARVAFARSVKTSPKEYVDQSVSYMVASDRTTGVGSNDQVILDRVAAIWDFLSAGYA